MFFFLFLNRSRVRVACGHVIRRAAKPLGNHHSRAVRVAISAILMCPLEVHRCRRFVPDDTRAGPRSDPPELVSAATSLASLALRVVAIHLVHHQAVAKVPAIDDYIGTGDTFDPGWRPVIDDVDLVKGLDDLL